MVTQSALDTKPFLEHRAFPRASDGRENAPLKTPAALEIRPPSVPLRVLMIITPTRSAAAVCLDHPDYRCGAVKPAWWSGTIGNDRLVRSTISSRIWLLAGLEMVFDVLHHRTMKPASQPEALVVRHLKILLLG
jgi:hypothetical protein